MSEAKTQTTPKSDSAGIDAKAIGEAIAEGLAKANYDPIHESRKKDADREEQISKDFIKNGKVNVPYEVSYFYSGVEYKGTWNVSTRILEPKCDKDHAVARTCIALGLKSQANSLTKQFDNIATVLDLGPIVLSQNNQARLDDLAPTLGYETIIPLYTGAVHNSKFKERVNKDVKLTKLKA